MIEMIIQILLEGLVGLLLKSTPIEKSKLIRSKIDMLSLQIGHSDEVTSVAFSPDGKTALSGSFDGSMKWWDLSSGRIIKSFELYSESVDSVAFERESI